MTSPEGDPTGGLAVIGTGLIGTSIAMAVQGSGQSVRGFDADREALLRAATRSALEPAPTLEECLSEARLVVVCVPVEAIPDVSSMCLEAAPEAVITDVGSVKAPLLARLEVEAGQDAYARFVGGHPMAGSERSGPDAASASMFEGAVWALTPTSGTDPRAAVMVEEWVRSLGARPLRMDAEAHDRGVAMVSHLPQVASTALMVAAARAERDEPASLQLSGPGFAGMTRLAASNPRLWSEILGANREPVLHALDGYLGVLREIRRMLEVDGPMLEEALAEGARARSEFEADHAGPLGPLS